MSIRILIRAMPIAALSMLAVVANATTAVMLNPQVQAPDISACTLNVDCITTLTLSMDFTGDPTLGGGIDFKVTGPVSITAFTPSAFWNANQEADLWGYGNNSGSQINQFEVHFANTSGLTGENLLGTLTVKLNGIGTGNIDMRVNDCQVCFGGEFFSSLDPYPKQTPTFTNAVINVVPAPPAVWMLLTGLGTLALRRSRRLSRATSVT